MVSNDEFKNATERGARLRRKGPNAVAVRFDRKANRIVVNLNSGVDISFAPQAAEGLENATARQLEHIEVTPSGLGLHFPKLDADLYVPALLEGVLGSRKWIAARLGAAGGRSTSVAKKRASRANGRRGGRPRKSAPGA